MKFTTHALHTLDVRGITETELRRALTEDSVQIRIDEKTGNSVLMTSRFIVVGNQNDDAFLVRAVVNADEIHA